MPTAAIHLALLTNRPPGPRLAIRPASASLARYIGSRLRRADLVEIGITSPSVAPSEVAVRSLERSFWCKTAEVDGSPAAIFGVVADTDPRIGVPWMLATDDLAKVSREFLRQGREEIAAMSAQFECLSNLVHRENASSIRWLEWSGFTVDRERPVGPNNQLLVFWKGDCHRV